MGPLQALHLIPLESGMNRLLKHAMADMPSRAFNITENYYSYSEATICLNKANPHGHPL